MQVRILGVRGSVPTPTPENLRYGGNTSCVQVVVPGGDTFLFDGGTGIRTAGAEWTSQGDAAPPIHLFLSHFHWDHLQGLPFFAPLYSPAADLTFYSSYEASALNASLSLQMSPPFFPLDFKKTAARKLFEQLRQDGMTFGDLHVRPFALHHAGGSTGYRISRNGSVIVFATDHEHGDSAADENLLQACEGADLLIYDAQYTQGEYASRVGWGHSTVDEGVRIAKLAGVKKLVLFHHDPMHDDAMVDAMVEGAQAQFPSTFGAAEGSAFDIGQEAPSL